MRVAPDKIGSSKSLRQDQSGVFHFEPVLQFARGEPSMLHVLHATWVFWYGVFRMYMDDGAYPTWVDGMQLARLFDTLPAYSVRSGKCAGRVCSSNDTE